MDQERMIKKLIITSIIVFAFLPLVPNVSAGWGLKYATTANTIRAFDPPIAADTNNDGNLDSLFVAGRKFGTTDTGIILKIRSSDGHEMWRREYTDNDSANELNPIELYDVTGDGCPEVFTHFGSPSFGYQVGFICLNGVDGSTVWYNQDFTTRPAWHHFVIIADKSTNVPYIFFNSHPYVDNGPFYMRKLNAITGVEVGTGVVSGGSCNGGLSAADIDYDGDVDLVLGLHFSPGFEVYDTDLNLVWSAGFATLSSTQCTKLIDICGDDTLDLVSLRQCSPGYSNAGLNVVDGGTHQKNEALSVPDYSVYGWPSSAHEDGSIADYDNDGFYEITSGYVSPTYAQLHEINNPPELDTTLIALGVGSGAPYFADLVGDSRLELVYTGMVLDTINFQPIQGLTPDGWAGMLADIDNNDNGLAEFFLSRNGQITVYNTDKPAIPGINAGSSHWGYRRLNSQIPYQECPGTMWYTWAEWEEDHQGDPLSCFAGGPYSGQIGQLIQFTGSATGGILPYLMHWSFGDGTTSNIQNPTHAYNTPGVYDITLTVTDDNSTTVTDQTTATITEILLPELQISTITSGFGIKTVLKNTGAGEATNVTWGITLTGGTFIGKLSKGVIATIVAGADKSIKSNLIFGIGKTTILVIATCDQEVTVEQNATGFVFGPFVLEVK